MRGFGDYTTVTGTLASALYAQLQAGGQAAVANVQSQLQAMTAADQQGSCAAMQQMSTPGGGQQRAWRNPWQNQYGQYEQAAAGPVYGQQQYDPQVPVEQAAAGPVYGQGQGQGQQDDGSWASYGQQGRGQMASDGSSMASLVATVCAGSTVATPSGGSALLAGGLAAALILYALLA